MNPRDSIVIAVSDSAVSITAGGIPAMIWLTDGKERREVNHDGSSYRTKADWKKDVLSTARGEPGLPMIERRLRMTRDGTIEMTFPGVIRARNYPSKLVFTRNRAVP